MKLPSSPALLLKMRDSRLASLGSVRPLVAASLVESLRTCGKPSCRCASGDKHIGHALTFKEEGKTRSVYVAKDRIEEVRQWVEEHRRVKELLAEISQLTVALLRAEARVRREQRKTPSS
jgi:hypothetical protein